MYDPQLTPQFFIFPHRFFTGLSFIGSLILFGVLDLSGFKGLSMSRIFGLCLFSYRGNHRALVDNVVSVLQESSSKGLTELPRIDGRPSHCLTCNLRMPLRAMFTNPVQAILNPRKATEPTPRFLNRNPSLQVLHTKRTPVTTKTITT